MDRYGWIFGVDREYFFRFLYISPEMRRWLELQGLDYDLIRDIYKNVSHSVDLERYCQNLTDWNRPAYLQYMPIQAERQDGGAQKLYSLRSFDVDQIIGNKIYGFYTGVLMSRKTLLDGEKWNYLDHLFGTPQLTPEDLDEIRKKGKKGPGQRLTVPEKWEPGSCGRDLPVIQRVIELLLTHRRVVIRLEKGCPSQWRARSLLAQIYSLLPPEMAIETGFLICADFRGNDSSWDRRIDHRWRGIIVTSGENDAECLRGEKIVDLEQLHELKTDSLGKSVMAWSQMDWSRRQEAMKKVFRNCAPWEIDDLVYERRTRKFFEDPFFSFKPVAGSCPTLEKLAMEFSRFPVLRLRIGWVMEECRKMIPTLMGSPDALAEQKAEAIWLAENAEDQKLREMSMKRYRFAQMLDPTDVSAKVIERMKNLPQEGSE